MPGLMSKRVQSKSYSFHNYPRKMVPNQTTPPTGNTYRRALTTTRVSTKDARIADLRRGKPFVFVWNYTSGLAELTFGGSEIYSPVWMTYEVFLNMAAAANPLRRFNQLKRAYEK